MLLNFNDWKFIWWIQENECYQEEIRNLQRKLLKLSRDKNFLLDRLQNFEKLSDSSDDDSDGSKVEDEKPKIKRFLKFSFFRGFYKIKNLEESATSLQQLRSRNQLENGLCQVFSSFSEKKPTVNLFQLTR